MCALRRRSLAGPLLAAVLALVSASLSACGEDDEGALAPDLEPDVPDVRGAEDLDDPYSGLLDEAFYEDLEAYANQEVTLLTEVAEVVSPRVFTVTSPEDAEVGPVLVVAAADAGDVDPQAGEQLYVAATPVESSDAEVVADQLPLQVDPQQLEEWDDALFLVAQVLQPAP